MKPGGNYSPYRIPCASTGNAVMTSWLGGAYQHGTAPVSQSIYTYNQTVPNPAGSGSNIPAYERWAPAPTGDCGGTPCNPSISPCEAWLGSNQTNGQQQYTLVAGQANTIPSPTYGQSWAVAPTICRKAGNKTVAAQRWWHGTFGFTSHDPSGVQSGICNAPINDQNGFPPGYSSGSYAWIPTYATTTYEPYQPSPDQTKYTSISYSATYTNNFYADLITTGTYFAQTSNGSGTVSVNPYSGEISSNLYTTDYRTSLFNGTSSVLINMAGGVGFNESGRYLSGGTSTIDNFLTVDLHGTGTPSFAGNDIPTAINNWNSNSIAGLDNGNPASAYLPPITSVTSYGGSATYTFPAEEQNTSTISLSYSKSDTSCTWTYVAQIFDPDDNLVSDVHYSGTVTLGGANTSADVLADAYGLLASWPLNDDNLYPWRTDGISESCPLVTRNEVQTNVDPSGIFYPYTSNDFRSPITDINGNTPFTQCSPGPFPGSCTYAPNNNDCSGVMSGSVSPPWGGCCGWESTYSQIPYIDPNAWSFIYADGTDPSCWAAEGLVHTLDGSILGQPLTSTATVQYQNYFNFGFEDMAGCGDPFDFYPLGYGATVGSINTEYGTQMPLNATQVTNQFFSIAVPPGAYIGYNDPTQVNTNGYPGYGEGGCVVYKYAEIKEAWPCQNWYIGGSQKFWIDESQVYCVNNLTQTGSGGVFQCTIYNGSSANPVFGTGSDLWGGPAVGGWYSGCSTDGSGNVTLGTQVYNVPSDWTSLADGVDTATLFGLLRWPSVPSLQGRQSCFINNYTGSWSSPQTSFGMSYPANSEQVDYYDANMNLIVGNVATLRVDDNTFSVPANDYTSVAYACITGSPPWYENDTYSKGNFIEADWTFDYRTNGEAARLLTQTDCSGSVLSGSTNLGFASANINAGCVGQSPCCPSIIAITPNGETWANNAVVYDMPATGSFLFDERYGTRYQAYVITAMTNLAWEGPHNPCGNGGAWVQDDGTCQSDGGSTIFYAHLPQVEPVQSAPSGYDTSVFTDAGITIGWVSAATSTASNALQPPSYIGFNSGGNPNQAYFPFMLRANMCSCIASSGRFATQYASQYPPC